MLPNIQFWIVGQCLFVIVLMADVAPDQLSIPCGETVTILSEPLGSKSGTRFPLRNFWLQVITWHKSTATNPTSWAAGLASALFALKSDSGRTHTLTELGVRSTLNRKSVCCHVRLLPREEDHMEAGVSQWGQENPLNRGSGQGVGWRRCENLAEPPEPLWLDVWLGGGSRALIGCWLYKALTLQPWFSWSSLRTSAS